MGDFVDRMRALRIGDRYQLVQLLGEGSFGKVYLGRDAETGNAVAMKLEHCKIDPSLLDEEIRVYQSLQSKPGFPRVFWHGWQDSFQVMVFELLGPNLEDLFCCCGETFSLKTTLMLADQLLHRFESLHAANYLHRDVKPENFLLGTGHHGNTVYMTDMGLAIYRPPVTARTAPGPPHLPISSERAPCEPSLIGTCRYASVNAHLGVPQSRRDDLEALGYMLIYFVTGPLPWQGLKTANRAEKNRRVLEMKQTVSVDELYQGLPPAFVTYMIYVRSLDEDD
ncbi:hypothetical protein PMZ80_011183 [Knufia obscura]|uniref:non-specific serine/threonine protein kinase n=2 Tax=Knufia TaxID=430999 RepID=A0AAN8I3J5_9EURO|nr:hypothetical protein PMZ80_011183 [Knufia obscura]KAK5950434.1 hypothetical protein OHC33_008653 [Knufia fluminis]